MDKSIKIFAQPLEPRPNERPEEVEWMASVCLDGKSFGAFTLHVAHPTGPLAQDALAAFLRDLADMVSDGPVLAHNAPAMEQ